MGKEELRKQALNGIGDIQDHPEYNVFAFEELLKLIPYLSDKGLKTLINDTSDIKKSMDY